MGWKSTHAITREIAISVIKKHIESCKDSTLERVVEIVNDDEDTNYPLGVGYDFVVSDTASKEFEERAEYERLKRKFE